MIKYPFAIANLILLTLAAYLIVDSAYQRKISGMVEITKEKFQAPEKINKKNPKNRKKALSREKKIITSRNLFNVQIDETKVNIEPKGEESPKIGTIKNTKLKLDLKGTVTGGTLIWAVIEDQRKREQSLYKEGDSIGPATIKSVHKDHVILIQDGRESRLDMSVESAVVTSNFSREHDLEERIEEAYKEGVSAPAPKSRSSKNNQIKIRPYYSKGKSKGFLLYGIRGNSDYRKLGLRNGDVLVEADSDVIKSQEDAMLAVEGLKDNTIEELTILRQGRERKVVAR